MRIVVSVTKKKEKLKQHYCWRHLCTFYLPKLGKGSRSQGVGRRQRHKLDIGEVVPPGSSTIWCVTKHTGMDKDKTSERNTLFGDQNLGVQGLMLHNSTQLNSTQLNLTSREEINYKYTLVWEWRGRRLRRCRRRLQTNCAVCDSQSGI